MFRIIGEKINGTRKSVGAAVVERNSDFIKDLAKRQAEAGSTWIDVNAGTSPEREPDDLVWLVETVQLAVDIPLCIDTPNPRALAAALPHAIKIPLVNSISMEPSRIEGVLPLAAARGCPVIALAMDESGIPTGMDGRLDVIRRIVAATRAAGIADGDVYVDPLVTAIATGTQSGLIAIGTMRAIRAEFPEVHMTSGLSNISFGLPVRHLVNRVYLTLAMEAGLDSAILDPLDRDLRASLLATDLLLGNDRHCLNYTRAFRAGILEPAAAAPKPIA
jgi:5-methyltetrahydrofolate corrinoid/iron sulfur protein methyltransferase